MITKKDLEHSLKMIDKGFVPIVKAGKTWGKVYAFGDVGSIIKHQKGKIVKLIKYPSDHHEIPNDFLIVIDWFEGKYLSLLQNYIGFDQLNENQISLIDYVLSKKFDQNK